MISPKLLERRLGTDLTAHAVDRKNTNEQLALFKYFIKYYMEFKSVLNLLIYFFM